MPKREPMNAAEAEDGRWRTTTVRLAPSAYRRLRRYVAAEEDRTAERATHQAIFEEALDEYLTKRRH